MKRAERRGRDGTGQDKSRQCLRWWQCFFNKALSSREGTFSIAGVGAGERSSGRLASPTAWSSARCTALHNLTHIGHVIYFRYRVLFFPLRDVVREPHHSKTVSSVRCTALHNLTHIGHIIYFRYRVLFFPLRDVVREPHHSKTCAQEPWHTEPHKENAI